jgi:hypothetical protein
MPPAQRTADRNQAGGIGEAPMRITLPTAADSYLRAKALPRGTCDE